MPLFSGDGRRNRPVLCVVACQVDQRLAEVLAVVIVRPDVVAIERDVLQDAFVAEVGKGDRIDLDRAVAAVEAIDLLGGEAPGKALRAADEHEVALLGRQGRVVPVDDEEIAAGRDVEVAGVQVGVTEHQIAWLRLHGFGMAGRPLDQIQRRVVMLAQERSQLGGQRVGE